MELLKKELKIIAACMEVSDELGLPESVSENASLSAPAEKGLRAQARVPLRAAFRNHVVGEFPADTLVEGRVIIEPKAAKALTAEHEAQVLTHLKAKGVNVGLLVNSKPRLDWYFSRMQVRVSKRDARSTTTSE